MLIAHAELFTPVDLKWRMFRKVIKPTLRDRVRVLAADPTDGASQSIADNLRESAFDLAPVPQLVLDADRSLVMANALARRLFGLVVGDFGRPVQDLELSYRPLELRTHIDVAGAERRTVDVDGIRWRIGDQERVLDVKLTPLMSDGVSLGTSITYRDVTDSQTLKREISTAKHELEEAYEELQSTVEELETTNEELQSTNEELETTNEELQSTNEELETMNEELQSSNEELETMNEELRNRSLELNDLNTFLETILKTIGLAVAVLDRRQHIQVWNRQARELWGLSTEETDDQHFLSLDIGLPVDQLKQPLRACLSGKTPREELVVTATNRRGGEFQCRVACMPLGSKSDAEVSGAIVIMEPVDGVRPADRPDAS
jgi:two-component system, chemotaxis family, CheB/CheR fusion protein